MKSWMLFPVLMLACAAAQADLYRWVYADGKFHYSDKLPPASIKQVEKKKAAGGKASEAPLPYPLQQAVKNFPVTLYSTECGNACTQARQLLAKRGIPYTEMDATDPSTQVELKKLTGGPVEVPVLKVGRDTLRGFEEGRWNTSLDAAGYPQTAMIPPRPPTKPAKPAAAAPPVAEPSRPAEESQ
jgi:glutaredoxin